MRRYIPLLVLCGVLVAPTLTHAKRVAIFDMRWAGAPPALQAEVSRHLEQALSDLTYTLKPLPPENESPVLPGCNTGPCVAEAGGLLGIDRALFGGVAAVGSSYDITLTLVETFTGNQLAQVVRRCDVCTFVEAGQATALALRELDARAAEFLATRSFLDISSDPPGYQVSINEMPHGQTPLRQMIAPGRHRLVATQTGQPTQTTTVTVGAGEVKEVVFGYFQTIGDSDDGLRPSSAPRVMSWGLWGLLGLGSALVVSGGTVWGVSDTSGERTAGIALTSAGASALVALGVMLVERLLEGKPVTLAVPPTPTAIGLSTTRTSAVPLHRFEVSARVGQQAASAAPFGPRGAATSSGVAAVAW